MPLQLHTPVMLCSRNPENFRDWALSMVPTVPRHGKSPPVDSFSGDSPKTTLQDCLPALETASVWIEWSEADQLAGHLKSKAPRMESSDSREQEYIHHCH